MPFPQTAKPLPDLVRAVLRTAGRLRREGKLSQATFEQQLERLRCEELTPRRLNLAVETDTEGNFRFSIQHSASGTLLERIACAEQEELIECDDLREQDHAEAVSDGEFSLQMSRR